MSDLNSFVIEENEKLKERLDWLEREVIKRAGVSHGCLRLLQDYRNEFTARAELALKAPAEAPEPRLAAQDKWFFQDLGGDWREGEMPEALTMTDEEVRIWRLIAARPKESPVRARTLASITGLPERTVRDIIKTLIEERSKPIGSRTTRPAGYYEVTDPEDREDQYWKCRRRGASTIARGAALRGVTLAEELKIIQRELFSGGENQDFHREEEGLNSPP